MRRNWLQEKVFGICVIIIGALGSLIMGLMLWTLLEIKTNLEESIYTVQTQINIITSRQNNGAKKIGEVIARHQEKINYNTDRIEKLERKLEE